MGKSWDQYRLGEPHEPPRRKGLKTLAIVGVLMAITILPAMAAKGGSGAANGGKGGPGGGGGGSTSGSSGIAWKMITDVNGDKSPDYADQITFTLASSPSSRPFVALDCYQGGARVYGFSAGIFPDYLFTQTYTLRSSLWTGGAADCTAQAYYTTSKGREVIFDRLDFPVAG